MTRTRVFCFCLSLAGLVACGDKAAAPAGDAPVATGGTVLAAKAALTVQLTQPVQSSLTTTVQANGSVAAWQEAVVGAQSNGLRIAEVRVNVGDQVQKGQVLATFTADMPQAELLQTQAALAEAEAALAEATANAARARELQTSGALSAQQINQFLTQERTAQARLKSQKALLQLQQLRLQQSRVLAPDKGVISARSATVGAVVPAGMELFRLIRGGRLEWRAEVPSVDLARLQPNQAVQIQGPGAAPVSGRVRMIAPTVDSNSRNGLVYVDLPQPGALRAGMFASGEFEIGSSQALTLPQSAVLLRDGFSYVYVLGAEQRVSQIKVQVGRRVGERVEITAGLDPQARVVASGAGFLADGDTVRVVASPASTAVLAPVVPMAASAAQR